MWKSCPPSESVKSWKVTEKLAHDDELAGLRSPSVRVKCGVGDNDIFVFLLICGLQETRKHR